jgi:hypothetical protein
MNELKIGIACDGISYMINDKYWWISQENDPSTALSELFEYLGIKTVITEDY